MDIAGVDVEIDVIKEYPELEDLVVNPSTEEQNFNSNKYGFKSVTINAIKGEELNLTPSTEEQVATGVFSKVKVNPIESKKLSATPTTEEQVITGLFDTVVVNPIETEELYAIPTTEEQIKTGLFNTVVVSPIQGETLNLAPTEEQQNYEGVYLGVNINPIQVEEITADLDFSSGDAIELTAQEGRYIKRATINKDANLTPENIKSGVSIAGISGDVADTSDADATSDDIIAGKTAYVANEKIAGTYIPLDTTDATATAGDILKDKTAYVNGEKITGTMEAGAGEYNTQMTVGSANFDIKKVITKIGKVDFSQTKSTSSAFYNFTGLKELPDLELTNSGSTTGLCMNCSALEKIGYVDCKNAQQMDAMFNGCSNLKSVGKLTLGTAVSRPKQFDKMFYSCRVLVTAPEISSINVQTTIEMFYYCMELVNVPLYGFFDNVTTYTRMFSGCDKLSNESLNNILLMCSKNKVASTKTLATLGLTSAQATVCQGLSNYQAFLDAGWTTGY